MKQKKAKERVVIVCARCGNEVTASPGMAKASLEGKYCCVKCDGPFKAREEAA